MNSITSLFQQAQLAEAAYADLGGISGLMDTQPFIDRLTASGISLAQATALVSEWRVVDHIPDTDTGFSATLFERLDAAGNGTGAFNLAIRGSTFDDFGKDFQSDIGDIVADGVVLDQLVDLYNYWQRLSTPTSSTYTAAELVTLNAETIALRAAYVLGPASGLAAEAALRAGGNVIIDHGIFPGAVTVRTVRFVDSSTLSDASLRQGAGFQGEILELTASGHSLGGHLAMAFTRLFSGLGASALAVNGLGFRPTDSNVDRMFSMLGGASGFNAEKIYNVFGLEGPEFAAQNTALLQQVGGYQGIFIESAAIFGQALGHRVGQMTDSLAIYDLFVKIDPTLNTPDPAIGIGKITDVLKSASNTSARSLEEALDALRKLFRDPAAQSFVRTTTDDREALYQNLNNADFQSRVAANSGLVSITLLVDQDALTIKANAISDIAYRYALKELNPFAIVGNNALFDPHNLTGGLDVYNPVSGNGALTPQWIADRAKFLTFKLDANSADRLFALDPSGANAWYQDRTLHESVYVVSSTGVGRSSAAVFEAFLTKTDAQRVFFGSESNDSEENALEGGGKSDFLYGGGGNDRLNGRGGEDYLQGDAGDDVLDGGTEDDTLFGGKGADKLDGGPGDDTYIWNTGDGFDTITDVREGIDNLKQGDILFLGASLAGAKEQVFVDNPRLFTDTMGILYALTGLPGAEGILTVVKPGEAGGLRLMDFRSGDFGIVIPAPTEPLKNDKLGTTNSDNSASTQPGHADTLVAVAPNQKVLGLDGNDRIIVAQLGAEAFGGIGHDYVTDGSGDQRLFGEAGNDILIASSGNDELYGDGGNDALQGGADDDYLDGGDGNDFLDGGTGSDVIIGGAGQDFILGGGTMIPAITEGEIDDPNGRPFGVVIDVNGGPAFINMVGFPDAASDGVNMIDAGDGDDVVFGGDAEDFIEGGAGSDLLVGLSGPDSIFGDEDNDSIFGDGTQGHVTINGQDIFTFPEFHAADYLDGGAGDDTLTGDGGDDELIGGDGADILIGDAADLDEQFHGADYLDGGAGNDTLVGYGKNDALFGGEGDDELGGDSLTLPAHLHGDDYLDGGAGNDILHGDGGSDILFGGTGNDSLHGDATNLAQAAHGNDYLDGGDGDDELQGGGGDDTLDGGPGNDFLSGEAGGDTYLFGHGLGRDEVNDAGGDGIDRIVLSADVLPQDVTLERSVDGNLTLVLSPEDRLTVTGHYSDEANRIEEIVFGDGTVLTVQDLDAVPLPPIMGTENADSLVGTNFPETLLGLGGDDTLDGGGGNDILEGGEGVDTYAFGLGMGRDTFIDDGGRIVLRPGLGFNDLSAVQRGDDLELTIRGTTTGASLLNYFALPQNWIIEDAVGLQINPDAVLDATAQRAADWVSAQRDDYHAALKERIASRYLSSDYVPTAEGTFFLPWQARPSLRDVTAFASWNTQTDTRTISIFGGGTSATTTTSGFTSWNNTIPLLIDSTVRITEETLVSDDPEIFPLGGSMQTDEFHPIVASVSWGGLQGDFGTVSELTRTEFIFGGEINPNTGQPIAIGTITTTTVFRNFSGVVDGKVIAIAPGATAQGGIFPQFINANLRLNTITEHISEVIGGPGDNEIFNASLIDAGDGNDIASGGFVYGGAGDDIIDGEVAIGGPGNDRIAGAKVYGGPGDDYLEGWFGPSRFIFDEQDSGRDTVTDTQGLDIEELADWYYTSIGIPDWEDRLFDPETEDRISINSGIAQGLLPPLPQLAANDWGALAPLYTAGLIAIDAVELKRGLGIGDVSLSWGQIASISPLSGVLEAYTTLELSWNAGDVASIVIPHSDDPLGTGVEEVRFDDGFVFSMQELLTVAPPAPSFDPQDQDNLLLGTPFDDNIRGRGGNDTLGGGLGEDFLEGGTGDDVYLFAQGDGSDVAFDEDGTDVVRFGDGITPGDVIFSVDYFGDATFTLPSGDSLRFSDWPNENSRIERVEFADDTIWDSAEIEAHTTIVPATEFDDFIGGTSGNDSIDGLGGDDLINGFAGDDVLFGNSGNDFLEGGAGSDILRGGDGNDGLLDEQGNNVLDGGAGDDFIHAYGAPYNSEGGSNFVVGGPGNDWIFSLAANNVIAFNAGDGNDNVHVVYPVTLSLGAGISPSSLALREEGGSLLLTIGASDSIRLTREFHPDPNAWPQITLQMFGSVHFYDFNAVIAEFHAALAANPSLTAFPLDDVLQTYETGVSETLALGGPLAYLYGTAGDLSTLSDDEIRETVGVADFGIAPQSIVVPGSNLAPIVDMPIVDQATLEDALFAFTLPANTFKDDDVGDTLTFDALHVDGGPLPDWLGFDAATRRFRGTPGNDDVGIFEITVTATDMGGLGVSDTFTLTVENTNDVPILLSPLSNQVGHQNASLAFSIPAGTFDDIDSGDALTFAAALADGHELPGWLDFDAETQTFSGMPGGGDSGRYLISVAATDSIGAFVTGGFELSISDAATTFASYQGTKRNDVIRTDFRNDFIDAGKGDDSIDSGAGRDLVIAGKGDDRVHGGYGNDYLLGGKGRDYLFGDGGHDVLFGEHGDDHLDGGDGNNVLDGGKGKDHIVAGAGNNLIIGGPGSDVLYGGSGHDVFLFNRGDGTATLRLEGAGTAENTDTISLGNNIAPGDIVLRRKNKDLIVSVVESNNDDDDDDDDAVNIVLEGWYRSAPVHQTVERLQLIDGRVEIYDFTALVARYDAATGGRERRWHAGTAMGDALLSISNTEAIGGALAYQYAMQGTLAYVPTTAIQETLADPLFGQSAQLVVDHDGPTLATFLVGEDGDDGGVDDFLALFGDSGIMDGPIPYAPAGTDEVQSLPLSTGKKQKDSDDSDADALIGSLIERWFSGDLGGSRSLRKFLDGDHSWDGGQRRIGRGAHHWTQDEIAACWRKTRKLLEAHFANQDPAALAGGGDHETSAGLGGSGYSQFVLSGDRLPRVSGNHLRRLEGLDEGLSKLNM